MHVSSTVTRFVAAVVLLAVIGVGAWRISAIGPGDQADTEVRVAVRPLADGRTEVAVQQRHADRDGDGWSERLLPDARFLPADAEPGRWLVSSPVSLSGDEAETEPLKIALIQTVGGTAHERRNSFKLAIRQINEAGGVFGRPVIGVIADINFDTDFAVAVARRLVEEEGVDAFVGPNTSAASLAVIEAVIEPLGTPTISPSATAPALSQARDRDFFFRAVPSDSALGPVLAQLARERGHGNLGLIYRDDAWGRGLFDSFREAWDGVLNAAALAVDTESCEDQLRQAAADGAQALVLFTFRNGSTLCVSQAVELELFDRFMFGDTDQSRALIRSLGPEILAGMIGTAAADNPDNPSARFWERTYTKAWGAPEHKSLTYVRAVYDAAIALALAAQSAQSTDGAAIRDHLRSIADGEGPAFGPSQLADALHAAEHGEPFDYVGVESSLAWDDHGDITRFTIGVWQFDADGQIEITRRIAYDLGN
ncbi:MAG: ABC transporter substrate-binding protein [Chloroflexota bacterium]|nr:ABC transporter substrate-binding protein [Chloroflexota bacterium]